jgi:hypothetical protein
LTQLTTSSEGCFSQGGKDSTFRAVEAAPSTSYSTSRGTAPRAPIATIALQREGHTRPDLVGVFARSASKSITLSPSIRGRKTMAAQLKGILGTR